MRCRLAVRRLEARDLPAVFTVLNLNDSGADSLRDCVAKANASPGADTINFQAGLAGTITLSSGEIAVSDAVSIQGPGLSVLTISGNNAQRLFKVSAAPAATAISFSGLTLANGMTSGFTAAGSAISGSSQALSLTSCALTNHKASGISGTGIGGAIVLTGGSLTAVNCVFSGNFATNRGGAVAIQGTGSKLTLIQCTVSNNTSASGGGIYANDNVSITACTISGNTATGDGGVNGWGGGLRIQGSGNPMIVRNSTFSGNIAQLNGGGIALTGNLVASSLTITNCTITGNSVISSAAGGGGGGISRNYSASVIALESTIVSGNVSVNGTDVLSSGTVNVKTSAIGSATGFTKTDQGGNLPFQPHANLKLGALADNGGPTLTHVPSADSPLVNAGSNPAALVNDQRGAGFPRIFGLAADIGSVEVPVFVVSNTNDSGSGSLRQVILEANGWAGPDTVTFDPAVFATPQTIKLTTGEIAIGDALTISGPAAKVTIDGNFTSRVFNTTTAPGKSAITLVNLVLTNAKASSPNSGGAIAAADESLTLRASAITNSSGGNGGGAVFISSGSLLIEDSSLAGNSAGDGGAVVVFSGGALTVRRSTLSGNTAADAGGAICFLSGGSLTVEGSTLSGNTANSTNAVAGGGAVYFSGTAAVFVVGNSTLSGNKATTTNGGAIGLRAFSGTAAIQNSTLTANSAGAGGGGVARTGGSGAVTLNSTIVAGNTNASTPDLSFNAVTNVGGNNNLIGVADAGNFTLTGKGNQAGTGFAPLDARLGPLANNGGPTFTHALLADSVAINRGANPAALANDQRGAGFPRQVGVAVDVGAVESTNSGPGVIAFDGGPGVLTPGVTAYQFTVTYADLDAINVASLDDGDITVTGPAFPGGVGAKFISVNDPTNGTPRTATYEVAAPAGGFTAAHSGIYTVSVNANQVQSVAGAFAACRWSGRSPR
jgi:predicted outer membrane repeat protein